MTSVATRNPFALLDDDASRSATPAPAPKAASAPAAQTTTSAPQRGARGGRGGPASRGGRYYPRGGKPSGDNATSPAAEGQEAAESGKRRFDGEGRGRGRGRGRGGPRGGDREGGRGGGRRPYDRHSATGKTDSDKKVHQGWGGDDGPTELQAETAATADANNDWATGAEGAAPSNDWGAPAEGAPAAGSGEADDAAAPAEGDRRAQEEEEDNTLTLDQYLAKQKENESSVIPKLEARKVETEDWADVTPLEKKDEEEFYVGKQKAAPKAKAKKEEKVFLEIDARFERPSRGGDRGGRGRGRGEGRGRGRGEGRGRGRGNRGSAAPTFNVDDETAFPVLS